MRKHNSRAPCASLANKIESKTHPIPPHIPRQPPIRLRIQIIREHRAALLRRGDREGPDAREDVGDEGGGVEEGDEAFVFCGGGVF